MSRPLKIVVAGGSVSLFVVPRAGRSEGTYGELLPGLLADDEVLVEVRHSGRWFDLVSDLRIRYEDGVRNHFPDVLILNYGMGESQPNVVPTWAARHFQAWNRSSHPVARSYRDHVAPSTWRGLRKLQRHTSRWPTYRLSPSRYVYELGRLISMVRAETGCLVLLLDLDPPGPRWEHWMPGMTERYKLYQEAQDRFVADLGDPLVRAVRVNHHLQEHDFATLLPDGIHRSALGHQLTAEALAEEIRTWLES